VAALDPGTPFPSIALRDETGAPAASPNGETLYAVFKTTCPTCELAWPYLERIRRISDDSMKDGKAVGLSVVAIAQDDPTKSRAFADRLGTRLETAYDADPWKASDALGVTNVPTLIRVGGDGVIAETVVGFDRERFRGLALRAAALAGKPPTELFLPSDNAPPIKPG
jgi:peroxiredoxin